MVINIQPLCFHGAGQWPAEPTLVIPAGEYLRVTWATSRNLTILTLWAGAELYYWRNTELGDALAGQNAHGHAAEGLPLLEAELEIDSLVLYNPGLADVVLKGAGQNGSVLGWHGRRS